MNHSKAFQSAIVAFHTAIDYEQSNNNKLAYGKYVEGLSLIGAALEDTTPFLKQPLVVNIHKRMLEFAKRSVDRLLIILQNEEFNHNIEVRSDNENANNVPESTYQKLYDSLPEIVTGVPPVNLHFPDEVAGFISPLSAVEEYNQRLIKVYENRINSLLDSSAKANLQLELQRRLAENDALAKKRYELWECERKMLADECHQIAEEKFSIQEKIKTGTVKDTDFTKQNLYAACLQFHKEHKWAQESSCKLIENLNTENYIKKMLTYFLQHGSHPLACILRQLQMKVLNKLSKLHISQTERGKNEETILEEHIKNIVSDTKEDLFVLTTVILTIWEPLDTETHRLIVMDVLHHLYFPTVKPHFIQLLRILLHHQEEKMQKCMLEYSQKMTPYPPALNSVITKLHQLSLMHSPSVMMTSLVEVLRALIAIHGGLEPNGNLQPLFIGLDDILPQLIQLILISNMSTLPAEVSFVEKFMPAKRALGEEGYAVTLFQSVLSYIYDNCASLT